MCRCGKPLAWLLPGPAVLVTRRRRNEMNLLKKIQVGVHSLTTKKEDADPEFVSAFETATALFK